MRIHHLNCGSHCPLGGPIFDGKSRGLFADICTHCLLLELNDQLVLVDTGYGLADQPGRRPRRLAHIWPLVLNPQLREADTALRQVEALGFSGRDVRHIVLTHLDFDHAGGIEDFPHATIHVMESERHAAEHKRRSFVDMQRYRPLDWHSVRDWQTYATAGESWFGFDAVRSLNGLPPEILMIPLAGHTHGHAGIAIRSGDGWLFNAGDAYLHHGELDPHHAHMPPGLRLYERIMMTDPPAARANLDRLRGLKGREPGISIFCSHDTTELEALRRRIPIEDVAYSDIRMG